MAQAVVASGNLGFKQELEAASNALATYEQLAGQRIPQNTLLDVIKEMERYCIDFTDESASLIGEIKTLTMTALDKYHRSTEIIYGWCGTASNLLNIYIETESGSFIRSFLNLFINTDEKVAKSQRDILITVLSDGKVKMNMAQDTLESSSESFNQAVGKLAALQIRLGRYSNDRWNVWMAKFASAHVNVFMAAIQALLMARAVSIIYLVALFVQGGAPTFLAQMASCQRMLTDVNRSVKKGNMGIDSLKKMVRKEVRIIEELKTQIDTTNYILPQESIRHEVIPAIKKTN